MSGLYTFSAQSCAEISSKATETDSSPKFKTFITSLVIFPASRVFCCSDFPGQSFTMTCGILSPSLSVLLVADLFHPVHNLPVECFLNRDVRHGGSGRSTMPVLQSWREPDHITGPDLLDRAALALHPTNTGCDNQRLT